MVLPFCDPEIAEGMAKIKKETVKVKEEVPEPAPLADAAPAIQDGHLAKRLLQKSRKIDCSGSTCRKESGYL